MAISSQALPGSPWVTWPGSDQGRSEAPTARCPSRPAPSCLHPVPSRSRAPDDRSPLRGVNPCWDGEPSSGPTLDREPPDRVRDGSTAGAACRGQTRRGPPVSSVGGVTRRSAGTLLPTENPDEPETHTTPPEALTIIDELLAEHTHDEAVAILNARGLTGGWRTPFTVASLTALCKAHGIPALRERLRAQGMLTVEETARQLGVSTDTVATWRRRVCSRRGASTAAAATSTTPVKAAHRCTTRPKPPTAEPTACSRPTSSPRSSA